MAQGQQSRGRTTQTRPPPRQQQAPPQQPVNQGAVAVYRPRIPMPLEAQRMGYELGQWQQFVDVVWPSAKTPQGVMLALDYCRSRNLDPFKRPVHVVPIWNSTLGREIESVWPGIGELRTTAMRTKDYGGIDDAKLGPMVKASLDTVTLDYPEWAQVTVYRLDRLGRKQAIVGPKVYWRETYATAKKDTLAPNSMWKKRPIGQLVKCAEAAALRSGFPEELGNTYSAEEMWGQVIDHSPTVEGGMPARPQRQQYIEQTASPPPPPPPAPAEPVMDVTDAEGEIVEYLRSNVADAIIAALDLAAKRPDKGEARRAVETIATNNRETYNALRDWNAEDAARIKARYDEITRELDPFALAGNGMKENGSQNDSQQDTAGTGTTGAGGAAEPNRSTAAGGSPAGARQQPPLTPERSPAGADWVKWSEEVIRAIRAADSRGRLAEINGQVSRYRMECPPALLQDIDLALSDRSSEV
jgi:phage recombination protein Bet